MPVGEAVAQPAAGRERAPAHPTVSILIPTKNRREDLVETVHSIITQARPPEELVVIDQTAESCEPQVAGALRAAGSAIRLKYIWAPEIRGLVSARIRGVAESGGDIVFFIDDDITLKPDSVANLMARYVERPDVAGICGVDIGGADVPWWLVLARRAYMLGPFHDERSLVNKQHRRLSEPIPARLISGGLMSYRRWVFDEFQFEGALWGHRWNSSNDFSYRVSNWYPLIIDPKVGVWHRKPYGDYTPEEFVQIRVSGTFFFFARNIKRDFVGWVSFIWVLVAIFVRSIWRGLQARALPMTLRAFFREVRRGIRFLRQPFTASY